MLIKSLNARTRLTYAELLIKICTLVNETFHNIIVLLRTLSLKTAEASESSWHSSGQLSLC